MARQYFVSSAAGQQEGPFEVTGLTRLWSIGRLTSTSTIWFEGQPGWLPLPRIEELCQQFCPELKPEAALTTASRSGSAAQSAPETQAPPAASAVANTQYVEENGFQTYTNPTTQEKWVWDDSRSEWLPHEQAMYMLGFDGTTAEKPPANPDEEEIDKRIQAARPIDTETPLLQPGMLDEAAAEEAAKAKRPGKKRTINPASNKTGDVSGVTEELEPEPPAGPQFVAADSFAGSRPGYLFQLGQKGLGYYWDEKSAEIRKRKRAEAMSEEERQARNKKKTEWRKKKKEQEWSDAKVNSYIYISGLPLDCTEDQLEAHFSKFGMIRRDPLSDQPLLKLYRDKVTGAVKGDARLSYVMEESTDLAISLADESEIKPGHKLAVQRAEFEQKGGTYIKKAKVVLTDEQKKRLELKRKEEASKLSWNEGMDDGRGLKIVVLKNVFHPDDARAAYNYYDELYDEVEEEMEKIGPVDKITVFERHPAGVVSVRFKTAATAELAIERLNGTKLSGRPITVEYFDGITDYRWKEEDTAEAEQKRLDDFGDWLTGGSNPNKI